MTTREVVGPIRRSTRIGCSQAHAFETFTERLTEWWPLETHSIGGRETLAATLEPWVGGRLFERMRDGREAFWARVLVWEPPRRLVLAWQVNPNTPAPTEIEVRFSPDGDGTRVDLEHRGWERLGTDGFEARRSYDSDWPMVLGRFSEAAAR